MRLDTILSWDKMKWDLIELFFVAIFVKMSKNWLKDAFIKSKINLCSMSHETNTKPWVKNENYVHKNGGKLNFYSLFLSFLWIQIKSNPFNTFLNAFQKRLDLKFYTLFFYSFFQIQINHKSNTSGFKSELKQTLFLQKVFTKTAPTIIQ